MRPAASPPCTRSLAALTLACIAALPAACGKTHVDGLYRYVPAARGAPAPGSRDAWTVRGEHPGFVVEDATRVDTGAAVRVRGTGPFYAGGVSPDAPFHQRVFRDRAMSSLWAELHAALGRRVASHSLALWMISGGWNYDERPESGGAWTVLVSDWRDVDAVVTRVGAFLAAHELCEQVVVRVRAPPQRYEFTAVEL